MRQTPIPMTIASSMLTVVPAGPVAASTFCISIVSFGSSAVSPAFRDLHQFESEADFAGKPSP